MRCHPVTPMEEADLRVHLSRQTDLPIGLMDFLQVASPESTDRFRAANRESGAVLIDVIDEGALASAGRLLWCVDRQPFLVGSSGVEYALLAYWRREGLIGAASPPPAPGKADRIVVLSGSCSPVTQAQIEYAGRNGFALVRLDVHGLSTGERATAAAEEASRAALGALSQGRSVVLFTAASPEDRVEVFRSPAEQARFRHTLSERSGQILNRVVDSSGVKRIMVAGGDTSSNAGRQLGIDALTFASHLAPGAPLCRAWAQIPERQGLEIVFKGGQCGKLDFFEAVLNGRNGEN